MVEVNRTSGASSPSVAAQGVNPMLPPEDDPDSTTRKALSHLSPSDRAFIEATTGEKITDKTRAASLFALSLAHDRMEGRLPAGAPITADYLHDFLQRNRVQSVEGTVSSVLTGDQLRAGLSYLSEYGGRARTDFDA